MTTTIWKPLYGFENRYLINKDGVIKSICRKHLNKIGRLHVAKECEIKKRIGRGGYWTVKLTSDSRLGTQNLHRLLATTFIENPENKPYVNHKNGDKLDNWLGNLEWVTPSENQLHAIKLKLCKPPHLNSIPVKDRCTGRTYPSMKAFSKATSIPYAKVKQMLRRNTGTCLQFAA